MTRDFTIQRYRQLLTALTEAGYQFQPFNDFILNPKGKVVILRHDVDKRPGNSLVTAQIENELGIKGSYYFRIVPESFTPEIIFKIANLEHEIGYHYEDIDLASGKMKKEKGVTNNEQVFTSQLINSAYELFLIHLEEIRKLVPVNTICMHGSPLSKYDNRMMWEQYSYKSLGIIGEPYFDIDFSRVFYLTDTGRCWNGERFSIRDKVGDQINLKGSFRKSLEIISAANSGLLPEKIMITVHPQRWSDDICLWTKELVLQNIKNIAKGYIVKRGNAKD